MNTIRLDRLYWHIPIMSRHTCDSGKCSYISEVVHEGSDITINLVPNDKYIDGKCEVFGQLTTSCINLSGYDITAPYTVDNMLYDPDMVIIPDNEFAICIRFPVSNPIDIKVSSTNSEITLRETLDIIKVIYQVLYREEEATATPTFFTIEEECLNCLSEINVHDIFTECKGDTNSDEEVLCSICYFPLSTEIGELKCSHIFHKECIRLWISKGSGQTCPLCRENLKTCDCTGGIVTRQIHTAVIPMESGPILRNTTTGTYGIYDYYIEDLYIDNLFYNNIDKRLFINFRVN